MGAFVTKNGQNVGYRRVSMDTQNLERQLVGLEIDKMFDDFCSGKNVERPQFTAMMQYLRDGDTLHVHSLDRLGRNMNDLRNTIEILQQRGVAVLFHNENIKFEGKSLNPINNLLFNLMCSFAEFERSVLLERQKEGIAVAKLQGKYKGRRPALSSEQNIEVKNLIALGVSKTRIAKQFRISRETVYQIIRKHNLGI